MGKEEYKEEIFEMVNNFEDEQILRYIYIIIKDIWEERDGKNG